MSFLQRQSIPLLVCDAKDEKNVRLLCHNAWMGFSAGQHFFAWQRELDSPHIRGRRVQRMFDILVDCVLVFCALAAPIIFSALSFFHSVEVISSWWIIFSGVSALYLIARRIRSYVTLGYVHPSAAIIEIDTSVSWESVSGFHRKSVIDMSSAFTPTALTAFEDAILWAEKNGVVCTSHLLFWRLLQTFEAKELLIRFELPPAEVMRVVKEKLVDATSSSNEKGAKADPDVWQMIAASYRYASEQHDPKVEIVHILTAIIELDYDIPILFEELGVQSEQLKNGLAWTMFSHRLSATMRAYRKAAALHNVSDVGAAMTGMATPLLNAVGRDITKEAAYGYLPYVVGRTTELETLVRVFESGGRGVVLVGSQGIGKMSVIEALGTRMVEGRVPEILNDKRLILIPISHIISGDNPSAYYVRLTTIIQEVARAGNIVLAFDGIEGIAGVRAGGDAGQDLSDSLAEITEQFSIPIIATSSTESYREQINGSKLGGVLSKIDIIEVDENTAIQILEARVSGIEARHSVFFTYAAIVQCVSMAKKFLQDMVLPESALSLLNETAVYVRNSRGKNEMVRGEDVGFVVAQKTHIPTTAVNADEREKLLALEKNMHERVIGQNEAVSSVASALRRARTNMRSGKRPIATFLFLGPTGVGKTETTKTLAKVYFGGEDRMIRFDMSEFQDSRGIYRLLGEPNQQGTGLLTEAVRGKPFSLILLDEFEKADPGVLNVFLQVMDDGRLTDSVGRVIDFTNTMIIATSNAGSQYIQDAVRRGDDTQVIKQGLLDRELKSYYKPELLNRFDGVIVFTPLSPEQIEEIAHIMVDDIARQLYSREGITLVVTDRAVSEIATRGYSPEFGARPLRRVIQEAVEDKVADALLKCSATRGQTITLDVGGSVRVS